MDNRITIALCAVVAFGVTAALGKVLVPWLRRLKVGQTILEIGPKWHKAKEGIPTMGGLLFAVGVVLVVLVGVVPTAVRHWDAQAFKLLSGVVMALGFGLVGFWDDYIKVVKKRNEGLNIKQKTAAQVLIIGAYLAALWFAYGKAPHMWVPFAGDIVLPWWFFFPFGAAVLYAAVNAVNFTDGIDGLCTTVTATVATAFTAVALMLGFASTAATGAALLGACLGFYCWNRKPAKVIMGDVGALFLGGMVVALGFAIDCPWILLLFGLVYVIEGASDVIQIGYFKATHGKRIFKMAPIHHHFELSGWGELKIVRVFCAVNIVGIVLGFLILTRGGFFA
ncbi:MAG: phospho-N-acetylmuramoyl-pentapeptide-transferase [Oscillospiraceae bacterium]|nr:phospho-N-acetylmuramoyl-pentapeptide-transferase [Oscillospiraceae bacterium]